MSLVWELQEIEKREALQRVLASGVFHRSDQLKSLLRFVCEREIAGRGNGLSEYTVAIEGLGRPPHYSPFEDGTVRNRIHNLRRRLDQYYEVEHPGDPVRIVLPKGSYCPIFQRNQVPPPSRPPRPRLEVIESAPAAPRVHVWPAPPATFLLVAVLVVLGMTTGLLVGLKKTTGGVDPVLTAAWGPLLEKNSNPLICMATAAQLVLLQRPADSSARPAVSSPDLLAWYQTLPGLPPATEIHAGPSLTSPFWGDVAGALAVTRLLSSAGLTTEALPESAVQLPALYKRNLLMFGSPGFSNAVDLFLRDKPFRVRIADKEHGTVIWNVKPKPGEPAEYASREVFRDGNREIAFGLITVMPSWGDPRRRTVVFSGTLSPGTQAASEFFASPKQLQALSGLLRREGYSEFPASYQVVVRSKVIGTSALDVQYVTHRVIAKSRY